MSLFPADEINVSELLLDISKYGFIELYNVGGMDIIQIVNFVKHQTPHGLEKDSVLPDRNGLYTVYERNSKNKTTVGKPYLLTKDKLEGFYNKSLINSVVNSSETIQEQINKTELDQVKQDNNSYETVSISDQNALNPESFNLNPESFNKNICPPNGEPVPTKPKLNFKNEIQEIFEFWKATLKKNNRTVLDNQRKTKIQGRLKEGYTVDDIKSAITGCSKSSFHTEGNHTDLTLICRDATHLDQFMGYNQTGNTTENQPPSDQPVFKPEPVRQQYGRGLNKGVNA